jgi:hypothetical protein
VTSSKRARVLRALLEHARVNRFELERLAADHCPASTISDLKRDGLRIASRIVVVPGYAGLPARIAEYQLDPGSRGAALEWLARDGRARP